MKELNLYRLFEVCNILSKKESELSERDVFISFLGNCSGFGASTFESFLEYYSFKIENNSIVVFNDSGIPWEDYTTNDFSYVPICLLSFSAEKLEEWIEEEISNQLEQQEKEKLQLKENIRLQIERLQNKLTSL